MENNKPTKKYQQPSKAPTSPSRGTEMVEKESKEKKEQTPKYEGDYPALPRIV
jgi:hypothetical protein